MKRKIYALIGVGAFCLIFFAGAYWWYLNQQRWVGYTSKEVTVEGRKLNLLVADTAEKHSIGLMNVRKLYGYDGMIFIFSDVAPKSFWNENTLVDLDIYWMKDGKVVKKEILPSIQKTKTTKIINSNVAVDTVIEVIR